MTAAATTVVGFDLEAGATFGDWLAKHRSEFEGSLLDAGAVRLRGFGITDVHAFDVARAALIETPVSYVEKATPRRALADAVFTSTEFPAAETIALHNENSYALSWPGRLLFGCIEAPAVGGETPLADARAVLRRLSVELVSEFRRRGWMLVRNYGGGFGLPWQTAFDTDDPTEVERYCARARITPTWLADGRLRTEQVRPALARHPETGQLVWFNHVRFWHPSSLEPEVRELLEDGYGLDGLPYNTRYGDGGLIPDHVVAEIAAAYDAETVAEPWLQGDLVLIDNMLVAHGRRPYEGSRQVLVAMGDARILADCQP